jgi:hypothetical protein
VRGRAREALLVHEASPGHRDLDDVNGDAIHRRRKFLGEVNATVAAAFFALSGHQQLSADKRRQWYPLRMMSSQGKVEKTVPNAITMLKSDHVQVKRLLRQLGGKRGRRSAPFLPKTLPYTTPLLSS